MIRSLLTRRFLTHIKPTPRFHRTLANNATEATQSLQHHQRKTHHNAENANHWILRYKYVDDIETKRKEFREEHIKLGQLRCGTNIDQRCHSEASDYTGCGNSDNSC